MINFRISAEQANTLLVAINDSQETREDLGQTAKVEALGDLGRLLREAIESGTTPL